MPQSGCEAAVTLSFFDLWSVRRKTTAQSPHKGNPAGVFGGVHLKPCWLDALSTPTGLSVSRVQQRDRPTRAPAPRASDSHWFLDWLDRFAWFSSKGSIFNFISIEILYAGKYLKQPIYRTLRTGLWWHYVYTSGPGWMSESKLCVHTPITVVMGLGWNTL